MLISYKMDVTKAQKEKKERLDLLSYIGYSKYFQIATIFEPVYYNRALFKVLQIIGKEYKGKNSETHKGIRVIRDKIYNDSNGKIVVTKTEIKTLLKSFKRFVFKGSYIKISYQITIIIGCIFAIIHDNNNVKNSFYSYLANKKDVDIKDFKFDKTDIIRKHYDTMMVLCEDKTIDLFTARKEKIKKLLEEIDELVF